LRVFKSVFQLSPYQYLLKLRLEKAGELLKHTSIPVSIISIESGFQNITSFSRFFHQRYGYSPTEYRKTFSQRKLAILVN
jgi:transcriptional regulator GlxA family with amidase domain